MPKVEVSNILLILCLLSFPIFIWEPKYTEKILYLISIGSLILLAYKRKKIKFDFFSLALILFGVITLCWAYIQQGESPKFLSTYRSYKETGKLLIAMSFVIIAVNSLNLRPKRFFWPLYLLPALSLLVMILFFDHSYYIGGRLSVNMPATLTAYFFTFLMIAFLSLPKLHIFVKLAVAIFMYYLVFLTGTRAAIIMFPILLLICLFFDLKKIKNKKNIMIVIVVGFFIVGFLNKDIFIKRYNAIFYDLNAYSQNNSNTSIGARFSMFQMGMKTGNQSLLGQSIESRDESMRLQVLTDKKLESSIQYSNVHLHNDLIDLYSLKGILGALAYLILIISLIYTSYKNKSIYMFVFSIATIAYGMSDMIFYGRNMTLMWVITCIMMYIFSRKITRDEQNE
ncbi:O-antigen ligase family protein [Providencia sneebia]|uniref:O-antigen ligase-related domain-containing protein n=1 Tax=Providencia sneebia DSM 19967 TaxID=1141660 RepID=K8WV60_9GAMM|nr:O-antigen ligase family protein [Providencia sneebia]EKT61307.1 hypothetical protein OO7_01341 [Providencia sneebia DSM 19967]